MRKSFRIFAFALLGAAAMNMTACNGGEEEPAGTLNVSPKTLTFASDATEPQTVTVTSTGAWTAEADAGWITISPYSGGPDGTITVSVEAGTEQRSGSIKVNSGTLSETVTVNQSASGVVSVTDVELNETTLAMEVGDNVTLIATVTPTEATNPKVEWRSDADATATVDVNGLVTAITPGTATITATTEDGGNKASCIVTVTEAVDVLTKITDPAFLAYCTEQMVGWDKDSDGKLSRTEAAAVERIEMARDSYYQGDKVASFAGIEYFTELYYLFCEFNALTELDLSSNTRLIELTCNDNQLTSLNISKCAELLTLNCSNNLITELDATGCPALTTLLCFNKYNSRTLTSVNVSGCAALESLQCYNNFALTSVNVSGCVALNDYKCYNCNFSTIDLSGLPELSILDCSYNFQLTSLNVSYCTDLEYLNAEFNEQCTSVDFSGCTSLGYLYLAYNKLSSLDISELTSLVLFGCYANPGDGVSKFPVKAWFDNNSVPYDFEKVASWEIYNAEEDTYPSITLEYQKVI